MPVNTAPRESGKFPSLSPIAPAISCPILPKGWSHRVLLRVWARHTAPTADHCPGTRAAAKLSLNSPPLCSHLNHPSCQTNLHLSSLTRFLLQQLRPPSVFQIRKTCWREWVYRILRVKIHCSTFWDIFKVLSVCWSCPFYDRLGWVGVILSLSSFKSFVDCFTIWRRRPYFINYYIKIIKIKSLI